MENQKPYGSEPIGQVDNSEPEEAVDEVVEAPAEPEKPKEDDNIKRLEKMLQDSKSMVGRQSNEIGELRKKLEELGKPKEPEGPNADEQIAQIMRQMDEGEVTINEGMRQVLALNSQLTASQVMGELSKQRQHEKAMEVQNKFLKENPDFNEVVDSGQLQPYLDADPLADEYVAYKEWKKDQKIAALEAEYQAKIQAAKEEGAKLAKGAQKAGQVIGKQGASPQPTRPNRPFKNQQEATDAMMQTLRELRSQSA
jgi:hypothetical protein